jgi:hypothetical protein
MYSSARCTLLLVTGSRVCRASYAKVLSVQVPQALHEDLVLLGHPRGVHKCLGNVLPFRHLIKVEKNVVEEREFVVRRHVGIADLLVQLLQSVVGFGGVDFG